MLAKFVSQPWKKIVKDYLTGIYIIIYIIILLFQYFVQNRGVDAVFTHVII